MFLLAIGAVISTSDRYKRQNKPSKLATNLSVAMHALSARSWRENFSCCQLPSAAIRLQFLSYFTAACLSSLTSGTERTARALSKVSTDKLNLMIGALL